MTHRDHRSRVDFETQADSDSPGSFHELLELLVEHGFEGMAQAAVTLAREIVAAGPPDIRWCGWLCRDEQGNWQARTKSAPAQGALYVLIPAGGVRSETRAIAPQ